MKLLLGFALAFNMLTIIPFFKVHHFFKGVNGHSAMFYPLVGAILGLLLWGAHSILKDVVPQAHLAVIIFSLWVALTGALHLDGLSDTIDGLFVKKERAFEVMKESHVGGMGMLFSFVFLALKLSSVVHFNAYHLLPALLAYARFNALLAIRFYPYASSGVGALLKEEFSFTMLLAAFASVGLLGYFSSFLLALLLSTLFLFSLAPLFVKRLGGLSGDIYGFVIETSELLLLNIVILGLS
jgi:adenosylcobinamide-GDP ribazoletransferase